jgi:hypothetical protein
MRIALSALILTVLATTTALADCPSPQPLFPGGKVSDQQLQDLIASVKLRPGTHCKPFGPMQIQCNSDSLPELWWFTEAGHPAHPAASRGQLMYNEQTREACLVRDGYFAGQESAFVDWLAELKRYDERIVASFKK